MNSWYDVKAVFVLILLGIAPLMVAAGMWELWQRWLGKKEKR